MISDTQLLYSMFYMTQIVNEGKQSRDEPHWLLAFNHTSNMPQITTLVSIAFKLLIMHAENMVAWHFSRCTPCTQSSLTYIK